MGPTSFRKEGSAGEDSGGYKKQGERDTREAWERVGCGLGHNVSQVLVLVGI